MTSHLHCHLGAGLPGCVRGACTPGSRRRPFRLVVRAEDAPAIAEKPKLSGRPTLRSPPKQQPDYRGIVGPRTRREREERVQGQQQQGQRQQGQQQQGQRQQGDDRVPHSSNQSGYDRQPDGGRQQGDNRGYQRDRQQPNGGQGYDRQQRAYNAKDDAGQRERERPPPDWRRASEARRPTLDDAQQPPSSAQQSVSDGPSSRPQQQPTLNGAGGSAGSPQPQANAAASQELRRPTPRRPEAPLPSLDRRPPRRENGSANGARSPAPSDRPQRQSPGGAPPSSRPASQPGSLQPDWRADNARGGKGRPKGGGGRSDDGPPRRFSGKRTNVGRRRETRETRRRDRAIARRDAEPVRQDLFEIPEEGMGVEELANTLAMPAGEVVKVLFMKGIMVQVNQVLDQETVHLVVDDMEDVEAIDAQAAGVGEWARKSRDWVDEEDLDFLLPRPPVVTIMGHVDHGKTSLLDFVRKTKVAAGEAGGITQAIGAYTVQVEHDGEDAAITFLDTPGHEAFSAMRARGTRVTDIAVVVVAADDGVRPQTQEAISHAKAADVPIIIALNKIDKDGAEPERVKQELSELGLLPEEWGGQTSMVPISAKHGQGVDNLLETILLQAEVEELMSNPDRAARGTVIEAHLDKRRGPVATLLVQAGTLRLGDVVVASASHGKVKSLAESTGEVETATPSIAVQMVGLNSVPTAGDEFYVCEDESMGRKAAAVAEDAMRSDRLAAAAGGGNIVTTKSWVSMDDEEGEALQRLNVILKADASGTLEAVKAALGALPQENVILRFLLAAPNQVTTSDVDLAAASEAMILGFNTEPTETVLAAAKEKGVLLKSYNVIYTLVDDVRAAMEGRLNSVEERTPIGEAEVRATFGSGNRIVAGCMVNEGMLARGAFIVVKRGSRVVFEGPLTSLRRVKDDVKEVSHGLECGVRADGFSSWKDGDIIEAFWVEEKRRTLEEAATTQSENPFNSRNSIDPDDD